MSVFLSVVVPVYKVEPYLRQCIESIIQQSMDDMEIILVDDGSPDSCPQICDEYAKKDSRVHVIHQKNQGSVKARKTGSLFASGKYITFVDSDDWIEPDMYSTMKKLVEEIDTDILITDYFYEINGKSIRCKNKLEAGYYKEKDLEDLQKKMIYSGEFFYCGIFPCLWNKWYKREILLPNIMNIDDKITMGDDMACTYPCIIDAKTVRIYDEKSFYHYRFHSQSMTNNIDTNYFKSFSFLYNYIERCFKEKGRGDLLEQLQYHKVFTTIAGIEQAIGNIRFVFSRRWLENLEFCWGNSNIFKNLKGVEINLLRIPSPYKLVYKAFVQKKKCMLYIYVQILKVYKKLCVKE